MIYHLTTGAVWDGAQAAGTYTCSTRGRSLADEGFIHCSTAEQWPAVRQAFFSGVDHVLLLHVDEQALSAPLRWDEVAGAGLFPHIYGPLNLDAVRRVEPLPGC